MGQGTSQRIPRVGENFFIFPLVGEGEIWYDVRVHKEKQA